jgi:Flp pilus assembly protein TadG
MVEFAMTAPILMLLVGAAVEFSRANMIHSSIENAVYEGARGGIVPGATAADIEERCREVLKAALIRDATVRVQPDVITDATAEVLVTVVVPADTNSVIAPVFLRGKSLTRTCILPREGFYTTDQPAGPTEPLPKPRGGGRQRSRL